VIYICSWLHHEPSGLAWYTEILLYSDRARYIWPWGTTLGYWDNDWDMPYWALTYSG
jgi:hypothetical protein